MLIDDFVDVFLIHIGVPDLFRINDHHGPLLAAIQATGLVDPDLSLAVLTGFLEPLFRIITELRRPTLRATPSTIFAKVLAEKNMVLEIRVCHRMIIRVGGELVTGCWGKDTI